MNPIVKTELLKRIQDNDTLFAVIGPELRLRRKLLNKTLKFIAYKICSISYVCKIESSAINPNRAFLSEISKRIDMTEEEIDGLFDLRECLKEGIRGLLFNDNSKVLNIINEKREYENYRFKLLKFLNYLQTNDLLSARKIYDNLLDIMKTMVSFDFKVFVLLSSIYLYKCGAIIEAYDSLKLLDEMELDKYMKMALDLYIFNCLNSLCRPETVLYYQKTKENLLNIGAYDMLDEINYNFALFFIRTGSVDYSEQIINTIKNEKRRKSITLISAYLSEKSISQFKKKDLLASAKCLFDYIHDKKSLLDDIEESKKDYYQLDFNDLVFNYMLKENNLEKYDYLINVVINKLKKCDDVFVKRFFVKEAYKISEQSAKYKILFDMFKTYYKEEFI